MLTATPITYMERVSIMISLLRIVFVSKKMRYFLFLISNRSDQANVSGTVAGVMYCKNCLATIPYFAIRLVKPRAYHSPNPGMRPRLTRFIGKRVPHFATKNLMWGNSMLELVDKFGSDEVCRS